MLNIIAIIGLLVLIESNNNCFICALRIGSLTKEMAVLLAEYSLDWGNRVIQNIA